VIGNDIVDLKKARVESNIFRSRYLEKICSQSEIDLIYKSLVPIATFWRIWTMKESAYKAFQRKFKTKMLFNPFAFECYLENSTAGVVKLKKQKLLTATIQTSDFIYSEVTSTRASRSFFGATSDFLDQIKLEYDLCCVPELCKTREGVPFLKLPSEMLDFSKTHHGSFQVFQY